MNTGTAPKKKGKASFFGIPHKTLVIALAVVILAALIVFLTAFSPFVTIPCRGTRASSPPSAAWRTTRSARGSTSKARSSRSSSWIRARSALP